MIWKVILSVTLTTPLQCLDEDHDGEQKSPIFVNHYLRTFHVLAPSREAAIRFAIDQVEDGSVGAHPRVHHGRPSGLSAWFKYAWLQIGPQPRLFSKSGRIFCPASDS